VTIGPTSAVSVGYCYACEGEEQATFVICSTCREAIAFLREHLELFVDTVAQALRQEIEEFAAE